MTWTTRRVQELAVLINGHPFDSATFGPDGDLPLVRIRDMATREFQTFVDYADAPASAIIANGDVVIGMDGDFNVVIWRRGDAALNQRLCLLRANNGTDPRFLAYALPAPLKTINDLTYSTTVKHLSSPQVRSIRLLTPDSARQRVIADFLDRETARIDTLIAKQEQLIATLRERRRAVLDEVSRTAIGEGVRLKYLFAPSQDRNFPQEPVLSVYRDYGVIRKDSRDDNSNQTPLDVSRYLLVRPDDLVVNRMKAWQGSLGVSTHHGIVSGDYEVARPTTTCLAPRFAHLLLRSPQMIAEYAVRSTGIRPSQWLVLGRDGQH